MIPGFASAERVWENMLPPEDIDRCEDGECAECPECLAAAAQDEAEAYAEMQRDEQRLESRHGA